jgi:hypothetical protein
MRIVATSFEDKYRPTVRNIVGNLSNSIFSMLRIYHYSYGDFITLDGYHHDVPLEIVQSLDKMALECSSHDFLISFTHKAIYPH